VKTTKEQLAEVRKIARLAQRFMARKDYPPINLCLALLAEVGTKKAENQRKRKR
jgi:hypothetical protein